MGKDKRLLEHDTIHDCLRYLDRGLTLYFYNMLGLVFVAPFK